MNGTFHGRDVVDHDTSKVLAVLDDAVAHKLFTLFNEDQKGLELDLLIDNFSHHIEKRRHVCLTVDLDHLLLLSIVLEEMD